MIRRLFAFFRCQHAEDVRLRKPDGSYHVECPRCGRIKPIIARSKQELRTFRANAVLPPKAKKSSSEPRVVRWGKP